MAVNAILINLILFSHKFFMLSLEYRIFDDSIQIIPKEKNNLIH